jgi:hypothetical protein
MKSGGSLEMLHLPNSAIFAFQSDIKINVIATNVLQTISIIEESEEKNISENGEKREFISNRNDLELYFFISICR